MLAAMLEPAAPTRTPRPFSSHPLTTPSPHTHLSPPTSSHPPFTHSPRTDRRTYTAEQSLKTRKIFGNKIDATIFKDFQLFSEWQKTNVNQDPLGLIMSSRAPQGLPALPWQLSQGLRRTSQGYPGTPRFPPASHGVPRPSNAHSGLPNASQTSQGVPVLPRASQSQKIFENL